MDFNTLDQYDSKKSSPVAISHQNDAFHSSQDIDFSENNHFQARNLPWCSRIFHLANSWKVSKIYVPMYCYRLRARYFEHLSEWNHFIYIWILHAPPNRKIKKEKVRQRRKKQAKLKKHKSKQSNQLKLLPQSTNLYTQSIFFLACNLLPQFYTLVAKNVKPTHRKK